MSLVSRRQSVYSQFTLTKTCTVRTCVKVDVARKIFENEGNPRENTVCKEDVKVREERGEEGDEEEGGYSLHGRCNRKRNYE